MKLFTEGVFKPVNFSFIAEGCVHLFEEGYGALCGGRGKEWTRDFSQYRLLVQ